MVSSPALAACCHYPVTILLYTKRSLLEQGNHAGLTALHYAVYCEQHEVVAQLVAQDADITAQAEFPDLDWGCVNAGDTPMHIAAHKGNIDAIQIMLKAYVSGLEGGLLEGGRGVGVVGGWSGAIWFTFCVFA